MSLHRISENDVHNITSGQVIADLGNIVKELVENAVDANSNSITITFKRFGLEGLEVQDNGDGIEPSDFENLCRKNFTSKLETFENLVDVKTLGFRGEALNSICNISQMTVTTATTKEAPKGWELTFNSDGELTEKKLVNQSKGTLVKVADIFKNLPVRKLNLEKNYRKEFQKCLQLLTSYLLILNNVRIIIYNIDISGKKKIMMKTTSNALIKDNIINVFGSTGLQGLEEVNYELELDDDHNVSLSGMLSDSSIGNGRLSKDRQYLFINKRPIEFKKILKLINTTYKKFNYLQFPMILLNFNIHEHLIDINVTPDKKTILLSNKYENILLGKLENFLENFWDNAGSYNIPVNDNYQDKIRERNQNLTQPKLSSFALFQETGSYNTNDLEVEVIERTAIRNSKVVETNNNDLSENDEDYEEQLNEDYEEQLNEDIEPEGIEPGDIEPEELVDDEPEDDEKNVDAKIVDEKMEEDIEDEDPNKHSEVDKLLDQSNFSDINVKNDSINLEENIIRSQLESSIEVNINPLDDSCNCHDHHSHSESSEPLFLNDSILESTDLNTQDIEMPILDNQEVKEKMSVVNQKIRISEEDLTPRNIKRMKFSSTPDDKSHKLETSDISDQKLSEKLLGLSIHKDDFTNMVIVGQFNKGFIIVYKRDTDDILIIDQHASDEKYNFEKLIDETTFENQPLVIPQKLDLNSIEKLTILNHLNVFEKNGFKFKTEVDDHIDNDTNYVEDLKQEQLYLTSLPYSKNTIFDLKDLNELIQLVEDRASSTNSIPRPSKVRSMFAMRACRSSIMIGQSLNKPKMENVVQHLSTLDKPWNCPHGRPTMRHLVKIDQWKPFNDDYQY